MKLSKIVLLGVVSVFLLAGCSNKHLCFDYNDENICPKEDARVIDVLSTFSTSDILNDTKTQVTFNNTIAIGEYMKLNVLPGFKGYMTIIAVSGDGSRTQIFPNEFAAYNLVKESKLVEVANDDYKLQAAAPAGLEYFIVMITQKRALFSISTKDGVLNAFEDDAAFKKVLQNVKEEKYGKHYLKLLPYYTYEKGNNETK